MKEITLSKVAEIFQEAPVLIVNDRICLFNFEISENSYGVTITYPDEGRANSIYFSKYRNSKVKIKNSFCWLKDVNDKIVKFSIHFQKDIEAINLI